MHHLHGAWVRECVVCLEVIVNAEGLPAFDQFQDKAGVMLRPVEIQLIDHPRGPTEQSQPPMDVPDRQHRGVLLRRGTEA
jgi:hypothetical protein